VKDLAKHEIAASPGFRIGVPPSTPNTPMLVMVKDIVPHCLSNVIRAASIRTLRAPWALDAVIRRRIRHRVGHESKG
jgi:hypothetical protein